MRWLRTLASCLLVLSLPWTSGCGSRDSDEALLREEFRIPPSATVVRYRAYPETAGWFGREGLDIHMVFQVGDADFREYAARAAASGTWRPLPIPETFLRRMATIETSKRMRVEQAVATGRPLAPEGSVHNRSEEQMLAAFVEALPAQPAQGIFQVRTAGNDIMRQPKSLYDKPERDLNDFMLAMLDPDRNQIIVKVRSIY